MRDELFKNLQLDPRIESYKNFFDHEWARSINEIAENAAKLDEFVFDLMVSLKGTSLTSALPLISVNVAESYSRAHRLEHLDNSLTVKLINHLAERLDQKVVLSPLQQADVRKAMLDLAFQLFEKTKRVTSEFPKQTLWDELVAVDPDEKKDSPRSEMRLAIWSCMRECFSGLFFAYEHFLVRCVHHQSGKYVRISDTKKFKKLCRETFGDVLAELIWFHPEVETARSVRHSLAHKGGQVTKELQATDHGLIVVDGVIQILPDDLHRLYGVLKPRISAIVTWAAPLPPFSR